MACRYNLPAQAIQLLLDRDKDKQTLMIRGINEQIPLHIAARCNAPVSVMKALLAHDPTHTTVLQRDSAGRIPLHVAFLRTSSTAVVEVLVQHMLLGSVERLGYDQWKHVMDTYVTYMASTPERDFMTREKLNVLTEAIQEMKERAVLLELAVWKESCLSSIFTESSSSQRLSCLNEFNEYWPKQHGTTHRHSLSEYKRECRIKSGAETIVRSVLPFLEGEPLVKYKQEFPETTTTTTQG